MSGLVASLVEAGERRPLAARALAAALVLFLLLWLQALRLPVERSIDPRSLVPLGGRAFLLRTDIAGSDVVTESTLVVLEDGRPLGPVHSPHDAIREQGGGRTSHWLRAVLFSTSDGSDPRTNGRRYALRLDWLPHEALVLVVFLLALATNARAARRALGRLEAAPPGALVLALVLVSLAFRLLVWASHPHDTYAGYQVKGLPFSDAASWDALAADFADGRRDDPTWSAWGARRPLFYVFLGAVYSLAGPSPDVARAVHVLLGALASGLALDLARRVAPLPLALVFALAHALAPYEARTSLAPVTEPLGNFLSIATLWALVRGASRLARGEGGAPVLFLGGVLLGLANLARPLNLQLALVAGLSLALVVRKNTPRVAWLTIGRGGAAFALGTVLTLAPWIARQRAVHGISTISENTAEILYAATSPKYGVWSADVTALAGDRPLGERVRFYEAGVRENLKEHLGWYISTVIRRAAADALLHRPPRWVVLLALGLALLAPGPLPTGRTLRATLGVLLLIAPLGHPLEALLWVLGAALAIAARRGPALLALAHVSTWALMSATAVTLDRRFTHALEALAAFLAALAVFHVIGRARETPLLVPELGQEPRPRSRALLALALALGVVFALGLVRAVLANLAYPSEREPAVLVQGDERDRLVLRALEGEGQVFAPLSARLEVRRTRVRQGYVARLAADERIDHWSGVFTPRPYAFLVLGTRPQVPEGPVVFAGPELPRGEVFLVGLPRKVSAAEGVFEAIAVIGADGVVSRPEPAAARARALELAR